MIHIHSYFELKHRATVCVICRKADVRRFALLGFSEKGAASKHVAGVRHISADSTVLLSLMGLTQRQVVFAGNIQSVIGARVAVFACDGRRFTIVPANADLTGCMLGGERQGPHHRLVLAVREYRSVLRSAMAYLNR